MDYHTADTKMNFYWVNIGATYQEVLQNKFLWAPLFSESPKDKNDPSKGTKIIHFPHWDNVGLVKRGDIIFCNFERNIQFIAVAKTDAYEADHPITRAFNTWQAKGNQVEIEIVDLETPLSIQGYISDSFKIRFNAESNPKVICDNDSVFQGYMASLSDAAGVILLKLAGDSESIVVEKSRYFSQHSPSINENEKKQKPTTKLALAESRIGQGKFRKDLLAHWETCPITGVLNPDLLIASHIYPWSLSNDTERLDPYNGFLLAVHVDRLFDKGLISFSDNGKIIISPLLSSKDAKALGINVSLAISVEPKHLPYLEKHRSLFSISN